MTTNRNKTLDKSFKTDELRPFLTESEFEKLSFHFLKGNGVYAWGTISRSFKSLEQTAFASPNIVKKITMVF